MKTQLYFCEIIFIANSKKSLIDIQDRENICVLRMTDILRPELIWVEGRCYRITDATTEVTPLHEHDLYENEMNYNDEVNEEEEDDFEVTMMDNSRFATNFHVSKHYVGSIIGKKGAIKMRIERDTKTSIKIPKQGEAGDIYIFGPTASNVKAARRRINLIVMSSRMKQRATHFLSIPMNTPEVMTNFQLFKEKVLGECPSRGLEESMFIRPEKLHLTLGVMCLMDNEERMIASKLLAEAKEKIIMLLLRDHLPLKIRLKGLSYMNDDPYQIDVLYANVTEEGWDGSGLLQTLGDSLVEHYYKTGFMDRFHGRENLKLHVTLINSKYRSNSSDIVEETPDSRKIRESFDGSEVLKKFADFDFGVMELKELHLSQRHSVGQDGYYQPTCVVSCN